MLKKEQRHPQGEGTSLCLLKMEPVRDFSGFFFLVDNWYDSFLKNIDQGLVITIQSCNITLKVPIGICCGPYDVIPRLSCKIGKEVSGGTSVSVKERIAACLAVFIKRATPTGGFGRGGVVSNGDRVTYEGKSLTPGMIKEMNVGDSIETVEPKSAGSDASQFLKMQWRLIGAGQGMSYEATSRDMSESNYSSARQGANEDEATFAEEIELLRHIASFTDEIAAAAKAYDPARITRYVITLANLFHSFYNACRIGGEENSLAHARLQLCGAVLTVIRNVLGMFNITAPERM